MGEYQQQTQSQTSDIDFENTESQTIMPIWGRLYSKKDKIPGLDLNSEEITIGRSESCTVVLKETDVSSGIWCRMSKEHLKISRLSCDITSPVIIRDCSRNGTYINGKKIGNDKKRILKNGDVISIAHPLYKVFVFKDLRVCDVAEYPNTITDVYFISKKLGSGACGQVSLIFDYRSCDQFAIKHVKKNMLSGRQKISVFNDPLKVMNEALIMKELSHPCIVKLYDIIENTDSVYMILEYMRGGDLLSRILSKSRLNEHLSKLFFYQMSKAVKYLHDKGITHRDLKPDNILLYTSDDETLLKISDFGLSKLVENDAIMKTLCGTPLYAAPEILETHWQGSYTQKVDIWSLGVVLFTCLSGTLPFSDEYGTPATRQIKNGKFRFNHSCWSRTTVQAKDLIKQMLTVEPGLRPSVCDVLNNVWLKDELIITKVQKLIEGLGDNSPPRKKNRNC